MKTPYVLMKNGMYYAHNDCGYVSRLLLAELYDKEYAIDYVKDHNEIRAIPITDLMVNLQDAQEYIDRIEVMRDVMLAETAKGEE